jgi:hypothetical protein
MVGMYGDLPSIKLAGSDEEVPGFPVQIPNPPKQAVLRLPKPEELMTYLSAQKSLYRDLGRRMGESEEVSTPKEDQKLFTAMRIDRGVEFDDAEALLAISQITRHRVVSCEQDGLTYVIKLQVIGGETTHTVAIPFQSDLQEYRRYVYKSRDLPHGVEERRFPPEVPVKLYDKIIKSTTGYVDGVPVPPHHKRSVIGELLSAIASLDPDFSPN